MRTAGGEGKKEEGRKGRLRAQATSALRASFLLTAFRLRRQLAILQLIEKNLLTLSTHAGDILPALASPVILTGFDEEGKPILVPAKNKITFKHLLNHSAGLSLPKNSSSESGRRKAGGRRERDR